MQTQEKCRLLADEIRNILSHGIVLDGDTAHYIDSTFSNPGIPELEGILKNDADCEKDSLLELIFFPDESIQLQLEELLEAFKLHPHDEPRILACLCEAPLHVSLRFADNRGTLQLLLPEDLAGLFLSRLQIGKHIDSRLLAAIDNFKGGKDSLRLKVKIRNSRFVPTADRIEVLRAFFEKIGPQSADVMECLDFLLDFLEELNEGDDPYRALMAKKKFYFLNLQKAAQLERRLQRTNMETFLLQGQRVVLIDPADARRKMQLIDRISRALFGKSEYFEPAGTDGQITVRLEKNGRP